MSGKVKLAVIRKNDDTPCPFGLKVPYACKKAGAIIERMAPIDVLGAEATDQEKEMLVKANSRLLTWSLMSGQAPERCTYASHLFPDKEAVDCNYGDTAPGQDQKGTLLGSPFYSHMFSGVALDGLYSVPLSYYSDSNISRNLYYGMYSLQGSTVISKDELKKLAADAIRQSTEEKQNR